MRSLRHAGFALSLVSLFGIAVVAGAQVSRQQTTSMVAEALSKARGLAPDGATAVGFADDLAIPDAQAATIAKTVNAERERLRDVRVCTARTPSACHLVGVRVFIQVDKLSVGGDTAHVQVSIMDETQDSRQPVHYQQVAVTLRRTGNGWRAVGVKRILET